MPETETFKSNYKANRRVYQPLFSDIAESFFEYMYSLDPDEIQELHSNLKANGWGVQSITEIQDVHYLQTVFNDVLLSQWETSLYKWINCCT